MSPSKNDCRVNVAIIGGGTAGAAAALALAKGGLSAQLIERSSGSVWKVGESLPPAAKPLLCDLGVWEQFVKGPHLISYGNRSAWGARNLETRDFIYGVDGHGWHLDRQQFDSLLASAAAAQGVRRRCRTRVTGWRRKPAKGWSLELTSKDESSLLDADFVIDASGRAGWFARQQGVRRERHDLLVGIVGLFNPIEAGPDQDTLTMVESVRDGWWHASLLPDRRLAVMLVTDSDIARRQQAASRNRWLSLLRETEHIDARVRASGYLPPDSLRTFNANSSRLSTAAGASWLAVGDAAIAYDPLSSQGIIMAMATAIAAAQAIQDSLGGNKNERNDKERLAAYADWLMRSYEGYLVSRQSYYALERRWPDAPFWNRRHAQAQPHGSRAQAQPLAAPLLNEGPLQAQRGAA